MSALRWSRTRRSTALAAVLAATVAVTALVAPTGVAADPTTGDADADAGEGEGDAQGGSEPTTSLTVAVAELPVTGWRSQGAVRSSIQGRGGGATSASGDEVDVEVTKDVERSLEELGAERTPDGLVVTLPETVLFDFDSAELLGGSTETIERVAEVLDYYDDVEIGVHGHTDSRGDDAYNQDLSEQRASAVADALAGAGVAGGRMETLGFGAADPVTPNETPSGEDDPDGRAQNRRVEIVLRED